MKEAPLEVVLITEVLQASLSQMGTSFPLHHSLDIADSRPRAGDRVFQQILRVCMVYDMIYDWLNYNQILFQLGAFCTGKYSIT